MRSLSGHNVPSHEMMMNRLLSGLKFVIFSAALVLAASSLHAQEKRHATSLIGAPKYGPDFKHFDYVNPNAPKGGSVRLTAIGTFDSFNVIPYKGAKAAGMASGFIYDRLMASSADEPSSEYAQVAEWVSYPPDFSSVTYKLRDEARWHDGKPITPGRRHLQHGRAEEVQSAACLLLQERHRRKKDGRTRSHLLFR